MFRSLYFKIIFALCVFIISILTITGVALINNVYAYYADDFYYAVDTCVAGENYASADMWDIYLRENSASLGLDEYRNYYIIPVTDFSDGGLIEIKYSSNTENIKLTPNLKTAINEKRDGDGKTFGGQYTDYAKYVSSDGNEFIIYIKDTQRQAVDFAVMLFKMFLVIAFLGILIAILLSYFLAKAFTSPLKRLTEETEKVASGDFSEDNLKVRGHDEIGELTVAFNNMKNILKYNIDKAAAEKNKLEIVFESLSDAVLAFDSEGNILQINETAKNLFLPNFQNISNMRDRLTFYRMARLLGIDKDEKQDENIFEKNGENSKMIEFRNVIFREKPLDINLAHFKYTDNGVEKNGLICVLRDTTVKYELDKFRREFVADVSHELRTPLTSIKGAVETVMNYPDMPSDTKYDFLNMASKECERLSRIVSDLLSLSRLDSQNMTWENETYFIDDLLKHLCEVLSVDINKRNHKIDCRCQDDIPSLFGDKGKIEQVLINIVSNAIKYTPDNGKIDIVAYAAENGVNVDITDNGIGIPEEDLPHIFDRFYRVEKARSSDSGGTGLGLAISKSIIESHGGFISVKSKVGEGTQVTVFIPYVAELGAAGK